MKEYGDVPPEPLTLIIPVAFPLQSTSIIDVVAIVKFDFGSLIVTDVVFVHPFLSFIPSVYEPAERLENVPEV